MELTYHRKGDYLFPNLVIETENAPQIGKYGMLRKTYLKENRPNWYQSMLATGKLTRHLDAEGLRKVLREMYHEEHTRLWRFTHHLRGARKGETGNDEE